MTDHATPCQDVLGRIPTSQHDTLLHFLAYLGDHTDKVTARHALTVAFESCEQGLPAFIAALDGVAAMARDAAGGDR